MIQIKPSKNPEGETWFGDTTPWMANKNGNARYRLAYKPIMNAILTPKAQQNPNNCLIGEKRRTFQAMMFDAPAGRGLDGSKGAVEASGLEYGDVILSINGMTMQDVGNTISIQADQQAEYRQLAKMLFGGLEGVDASELPGPGIGNWEPTQDLVLKLHKQGATFVVLDGPPHDKHSIEALAERPNVIAMHRERVTVLKDLLLRHPSLMFNDRAMAANRTHDLHTHYCLGHTLPPGLRPPFDQARSSSRRRASRGLGR